MQRGPQELPAGHGSLDALFAVGLCRYFVEK